MRRNFKTFAYIVARRAASWRSGCSRRLGCTRPAYVWARSRLECNRACKALHGNISTILVANVTSLPAAWKKLQLEEAELLIFQVVRMGSAALRKLAADAGCQVVYGAEVEGEILVAVMARQGTLSKVAACPSGRAQHCRWQMGGQHMCIRNGYYQGGTQGERDDADHVLVEWLEAAEVSGEPTLIAGDFNATQSEMPVSRWFAALGGLLQPTTCLPSRGQPRRIDWLLASRGLQPAIRGLAAVHWDIGVKPHAVQKFKVDLVEHRRFPKWHRATPPASMTAERPGALSGETADAQRQAPAVKPKGPSAEQTKQNRRRRAAKPRLAIGVLRPGEPEARSGSLH